MKPEELLVECSIATEVEVHMATYSLFATDHQWQVVLFERQEVSGMLTTHWNEASLVSASYLDRFTTEAKSLKNTLPLVPWRIRIIHPAPNLDSITRLYTRV